MNKEHRKALLDAAELIEKDINTGLCLSILHASGWQFDLDDIPEAQAFDPGFNYWWGTDTMKCPPYSEKCKQARLLGIAFMLTIPKDMLP